jgi:hypothetical protein
MLEGAKSLDHYLDRARTTALRRFTDPLVPHMSSHAIERTLRMDWRRYVAEVATWMPTDWRASVLWARHVPDLPVLEALLKGEMPAWVQQDPSLAPFADGDRSKIVATLEHSGLAALSPAKGESLAEPWSAHWRALWPRQHGADCRGLDRLCAVIGRHFRRLARADAQEGSVHHRGALEGAMSRMFRRCGSTPVAVFAHLVLLAVDLERLRGGLLRRRLFASESTERAA